MKKFKLTPLQKKYAPAIRWILNEDWTIEKHKDRQTGRTTLMAFEFIAMALRNPNKEIQVFDHHPSLSTTRLIMLPAIRNIWEANYLNSIQGKLTIYLSDFTIEFTN